MKKTRFWILLVLAFAALCAAGTLWVLFGRSGGTAARIYQDGVLVRTIDLSRVTGTEAFTVDGPAGSNTIEAEPGRIRVSHADCPDQVCVRQGWISDGVLPIVCLPNELVIELETGASEEVLDGVTG